MLKLICENPCVINSRISKEMGLDGIRSKYPFSCDGTMLYNIDKKDINLLTLGEIKQLEEYTQEEIE